MTSLLISHSRVGCWCALVHSRCWLFLDVQSQDPRRTNGSCPRLVRVLFKVRDPLIEAIKSEQHRMYAGELQVSEHCKHVRVMLRVDGPSVWCPGGGEGGWDSKWSLCVFCIFVMRFTFYLRIPFLGHQWNCCRWQHNSIHVEGLG